MTILPRIHPRFLMKTLRSCPNPKTEIFDLTTGITVTEK